MARKKGKSKASKPKAVPKPADSVTEAVPGTFEANQPMKACRLCESKGGPFLNIFDVDKLMPRKIEDLMPFVITENDDLPHLICFRCTAKVEELHEFILKCIKTQLSLRNSVGRTSPLILKISKQRFFWEKSLSMSNISNENICDVVIKKAMDNIKDTLDMIPKQCEPTEANQFSKTTLIETSKKSCVENVINLCVETSVVSPGNKTNMEPKDKSGVEDSTYKPVKFVDKQINRCSTHSNSIESDQSKSSNIWDAVKKKAIKNPLDALIKQCGPTGANRFSKTTLIETMKKSSVEHVINLCDETSSVVSPGNKTNMEPKDKSGIEDLTYKPVKHVDKYMNRRSTRSNPIESDQSISLNDNSKKNFQDTTVFTTNLRIENDSNVDKNEAYKSNKNVIEANQGEDSSKIPDKLFNIMDYVTTIKVNSVGVLFQCRLCNRNFLKRSVVKTHGCAETGIPKEELVKPAMPPEPRKTPVIKYINTKLESEAIPTTVHKDKSGNIRNSIETKISMTAENKNINDILQTVKPKPKIGPASKVKRDPHVVNPTIGMVGTPVECSSTGNQDSSYVSIQLPTKPSLTCPYKLKPGPNNTFTLVEKQDQQKAVNFNNSKKRLANDDLQQCVDTLPKSITIKKKKIMKHQDSKIFGDDNQTTTRQVDPVQPYPVGLFQTIPGKKRTGLAGANSEIFSTSALKKQSYTVVQTGNPSKLVISSIPRYSAEVNPTTRTRKSAAAQEAAEPEQPFSISLQNVSPPKDANFFTFVNVDPLLQPSYVLPTDNIQEAQISSRLNAQVGLQRSSNEKDHYTCNMCNQTFTIEKKLLAHIRSHYNKMDEEDQLRAEKHIEKHSSKRGRKS